MSSKFQINYEYIPPDPDYPNAKKWTHVIKLHCAEAVFAKHASGIHNLTLFMKWTLYRDRLLQEIEDWCYDTIGYHKHYPDDETFYYGFNTQGDAVLFKLRWAGT